MDELAAAIAPLERDRVVNVCFFWKVKEYFVDVICHDISLGTRKYVSGESSQRNIREHI